MRNAKQTNITSYAIFWLLIFIGFVRSLLEYYFFNYAHFDSELYNYWSHRFQLTVIAFFVLNYYIICIIVARLAKLPFKKVERSFAPYIIIILLSPIVDRLLGNRSAYVYLTKIDFFSAYSMWPGVFTVMLLTFAFCGIFVYKHSGIIRGCFTFLILTSHYYVIVSSFPIKFALWFVNFAAEPLPLQLNLKDNQVNSINSIIYLVLAIITLLLIYRTENPVKFKQLIHAHFRPLRLLNYLLLVVLGFILVNDVNLFRLFMLGATLVAVGCVFQFAILINDLWDNKIDRHAQSVRGAANSPMHLREIKQLSHICLTFAIFISLFLSRDALYMVIIMAVLSYIYSAPPFRLRSKVASSMIIGLVSGLCVLIGYLSQVPIYNLTFDTFSIALVVALGMGLGSNVIDLKDEVSDRANNVMSLAVKYGSTEARKIIAVLAFTGYLLISFQLFHLYEDIFFLLAGSIFALASGYTILYYANKMYFDKTIFLLQNAALLSIIILLIRY